MREKGDLTMMNIVTAREVGEYLKLTQSTIYNLALSGELPGFKVGNSWRFDMEEILEMIEMQKEPENRSE
jgi:excisionase family DNA binding protein